MAGYEPMYIEKDATAEEVVEAFGLFLHKCNYLLRQLDSKNVKRISTDMTEIKSDDGTTKIDGSQLVMLDGNNKERVRIGKGENGKFEFKIMNAKGRATITLSESGDATFSGDIDGANINGANIDIEEDVKVGNNIYLGTNNSGDEKKITLFDDGDDGKKGQIIALKDEKGYVTLSLKANKIYLSTMEGVYGFGDVRFVDTSFSPFVEIDGVQYPVKWK